MKDSRESSRTRFGPSRDISPNRHGSGSTVGHQQGTAKDQSDVEKLSTAHTPHPQTDSNLIGDDDSVLRDVEKAEGKREPEKEKERKDPN
ncbi:MAG: hypothetical protein Q9187_008739, partial [Circinaria calcarea]